MDNQWLNPDALRIARSQVETHSIPERDYQAWRSQLGSAKRRKIPFKFSLLGWHLWWQMALRQAGPDAQRGRGQWQLVMARKRDRGAYEPGNVYAATSRQNLADTSPEARAAGNDRASLTCIARGHPRGQHLQVRGDGHPKSHAVMTPAGRFGSIALAAEHYGITRAGGLARVRRGAWTLA